MDNNGVLMINEPVEDVYGHKHFLTDEISRGGQGAVFRTRDPNIAIKIELSDGRFQKGSDSNTVYNDIRLLPIPDNLKITMPKAVLKDWPGYVMDLLGDMDSFNNLLNPSYDLAPGENWDGFFVHNDWLDNIAKTSSWLAEIFSSYIYSGGSRRRLMLYMKYAGVLGQLHGAGLVFCDVSDNNVFASKDKNKYNVWLIDSDNVNYEAIYEKGNKSIVYTPGYAPPEVLDYNICTMYSDCYAFASGLFKALTCTHPFEGALLENESGDTFYEELEEKIYSGTVPWVLDKDDTSNYKTPIVPTDMICTDELMNLFHRMFSLDGRSDEYMRPTMPEWGEELARAADRTVRCKCCGMDSIYSGKCPWCDENIKTIKFKSHYMEDNSEIWEFVREADTDCKFDVPVRAAEGYSVSGIEKKAFSAALCENGKMILSDFSADYDAFISENGSDYVKIFGKYEAGNIFSLKLLPKNNIQGVIIEGGVSG